MNNIHLWIFEFNKRYDEGEHIGKILNNEQKLAEIYHYRDNEQGYFEIRTPTPEYPNDLKDSDILIGIYSNEKEIKDGVKKYYSDKK